MWWAKPLSLAGILLRFPLPRVRGNLRKTLQTCHCSIKDIMSRYHLCRGPWRFIAEVLWHPVGFIRLDPANKPPFSVTRSVDI